MRSAVAPTDHQAFTQAATGPFIPKAGVLPPCLAEEGKISARLLRWKPNAVIRNSAGLTDAHHAQRGAHSPVAFSDLPSSHSPPVPVALPKLGYLKTTNAVGASTGGEEHHPPPAATKRRNASMEGEELCRAGGKRVSDTSNRDGGRGRDEVRRIPINQASSQDFSGGGLGGGLGFQGSDRVECCSEWGEGNSCHGGEWVSGHGDHHGSGGRGSSDSRSTMRTTMTTTARPLNGVDGDGAEGLVMTTARMRPTWLAGGGDDDDTSSEDDPARRLASRRRKAAVVTAAAAAAAAATAIGITEPAFLKTSGWTRFREDAKRVSGAPPERHGGGVRDASNRDGGASYHDFRAGGAAEIQRTPANQVSTQNFGGSGYWRDQGFPGSGRVGRHHGGWGKGNSRRGGEWVSGHGDFHGGGGRGYPPPYHKASRGK